MLSIATGVLQYTNTFASNVQSSVTVYVSLCMISATLRVLNFTHITWYQMSQQYRRFKFFSYDMVLKYMKPTQWLLIVSGSCKLWNLLMSFAFPNYKEKLFLQHPQTYKISCAYQWSSTLLLCDIIWSCMLLINKIHSYQHGEGYSTFSNKSFIDKKKLFF